MSANTIRGTSPTGVNKEVNRTENPEARHLIPSNRNPIPANTAQQLQEARDQIEALQVEVGSLNNQPSGFEVAIRYAQFKIDVQELLDLTQLTTEDEKFVLETFKGLGEEFVTNFTLDDLNEKQFCVSGAYQAFTNGDIETQEVAADIAGCVAGNSVDSGVV